MELQRRADAAGLRLRSDRPGPAGRSACRGRRADAATQRRSRRVPHRIHPARGRPAACEGKYGESLFLTCSVWRQADEDVAVAVALARGARVVVCGRLKQRMYEDREGVKRAVVELDDEEIGPASRPPATGTRTAHRRRSSRSPRPVAAPPAPPAAGSA
ncbi:single-stranded DNA-binding protein [Streptomyces sp. NPDC058290]|uniref:single-stranded DNA-binding protein n=1 Tax=Streptomyces sp. NPDC058290 TaxID=3346426 RepID=UPI0036F18EEF